MTKTEQHILQTLQDGGDIWASPLDSKAYSTTEVKVYRRTTLTKMEKKGLLKSQIDYAGWGNEERALDTHWTLPTTL
jgi:hypothetical protein